MFVKKLAYLMVVVVVCLFGIGCIAATGLPGSAAKSAGGHQTGDVFTSSFLVRFKRSLDKQLVHEIASRNGFQNLGEVSIPYFKLYPSSLLGRCLCVCVFWENGEGRGFIVMEKGGMNGIVDTGGPSAASWCFVTLPYKTYGRRGGTV